MAHVQEFRTPKHLLGKTLVMMTLKRFGQHFQPLPSTYFCPHSASLVGWLVSEFILKGFSLGLLTSFLVIITIPSIVGSHQPAVPQEFTEQKSLLLSLWGRQYPLLHSCVYKHKQLFPASKRNSALALRKILGERALVFHKDNLSFSACGPELPYSVVCIVAFSWS